MQPEIQHEAQGHRFYCDVCTTSYTRLEHLQRHYRSHTNEKPFQCSEPGCEKAFARADLLKRHASVHDTDTSAEKRQKTTHETRPRVARACVACAKSKLRCDGNDVCSRCLKRNIACTYRPLVTNVEAIPRSTPSDSPSLLQRESVSIDLGGSPHHETRLQGSLSLPTWPAITNTSEPRTVTFNEFTPENQMSLNASVSEIDFDDSYLADFLRGVMNPVSSPLLQEPTERYDPNFAPKDFLNFNIATSFEYLDNFDMFQPFAGFEQSPFPPIPDDINTRPEHFVTSGARSGHATPNGKNGLSLSAQAFKESLWLWTPQQGEHFKADRANLSLPVEALMASEKEGMDEPPFPVLSQTARDRIMAAILNTCDGVRTSTVVSCFPSAELLTVLIQKWAIYHSHQIDSWFHLATFDPNKEDPEIVLGMVAAGGALSKNPRIRKLGYAFQEAARATVSSLFEADNRNIRRLKPWQVMSLQLHVGLWSGDRRKVEIAESFANPLITMIRRGGNFNTTDDGGSLQTRLSDRGEDLNQRWAAWIEAESVKRLVTHLFIRDCQTSASLLVPPLISFAEMRCPLPSHKSLWTARTAEEWASLMSTLGSQTTETSPSIRTCLHELSSGIMSRRRMDVEFAVLAISNAFWGYCWQHRQIESIVRQTWDDSHPSDGHLTNSVKRTTIQKMQQFRLITSEWLDLPPEAVLTCERQLMNLHVSLEDVQLLAGKAGEKEARRTFATLRQWAHNSDSRQAIWHAGQIIRAASRYPSLTLRDASAVAAYHAGLVFWAYAVLTNNVDKTNVNDKTHDRTNDTSHASQLVVLNDEAGPHLDRFVLLGRGCPAITTRATHDRQKTTVPLRDVKKVMNAIVDLLHAKNAGTGETCPPLVENLTKLMRSLGNAAQSIRNV